jgi:hypothetical protein
MSIVLNGNNGITFPDGSSQTGILGSVSQSLGIPTGALFESGSNANGSYLKFPNGTLICFMNRTETRTASGVLTTLMTFPVEFATSATIPPRNIDYYVPIVTMNTTVPNAALNIVVSNPTSTTIEVRIDRTTATSTVFFLTCIGRWY